MAETVVEFVVGKLANIILKEAQLLGGVGEQVEKVQRDLNRIRCCMRDADSKSKGDARVQNWLNELRDVAYRIEDATDTFFLEIEDNRQKDPTFLSKLKKLCHKPIEVPVLHKLAIELSVIQKVLEDIAKSRVDYGIESLQDKDKGEVIVLPFRRLAYQDVDETEIVGLQADKNEILKLLHPKETVRRAVVTIVGTGGLGKTTLAQMVYQSAKADFNFHIMLSVSQQFSLTDLLRKMLSKLKYSVPENREVGYLIRELKNSLSTRRYLIVLDDVWTVDLWNKLKDTLPDAKNGSRVLMTSRFVDTAKSADSKMKPYELNFLDDKASLDLLLKKALPYQEPDEVCPSDLLEVAEKLSKKCKGLPLALIVVGGILSTKEEFYPEWERVLRTMDWHSEGKDCMEVLAMSYEDLPYYLKACFLYLASFPEDHKISAKHLIRMWVAEGFIPQESRKTMEETAENCLEQLFQRSMIHVLRRSPNGSIKHFQVHDLLRDLAMHEASKENFVTVYPKGRDEKQLDRETRRASIQTGSLKFLEFVSSPNTRSLLWFGKYFPKYSGFRLLKVLEIVGVDMVNFTDQLNGLANLIHLKYLGFRNCRNYTQYINIPPGSFARMKNLETLDLRGTSIDCPPNGLWTISTLRHVLHDRPISGLPSRADLRNLQTLQWVSVMETWRRNQFPHLSSLRKLGLSNSLNRWPWDIVPHLLGTLPSLVSLGIKSQSSIPREIVYPGAVPNYQNLQSLHFDGQWSEDATLEARLFPQHLVSLTIMDTKFPQDPIPELGKLNNLKKLRLEGVWVNSKEMQMIFPEGFPVLQYLTLKDSYDCRITCLKVAKEVMPKLKYLSLPCNCVFEMPPELRQSVIIC